MAGAWLVVLVDPAVAPVVVLEVAAEGNQDPVDQAVRRVRLGWDMENLEYLMQGMEPVS